jgi:hypothetical protein
MYENSVWSQIALYSLNRMFMEDDTHTMKYKKLRSNLNNRVENKLYAGKDGLLPILSFGKRMIMCVQAITKIFM